MYSCPYFFELMLSNSVTCIPASRKFSQIPGVWVLCWPISNTLLYLWHYEWSVHMKTEAECVHSGASAMWLSGHTDVSEGVSPYTLAVVCPCRSAEPRSHSCWSGWLWSSASPGPAADWDTNTTQRLLANAQWNPHVSYNTRCSHGFGCCCSEWLKRTYSLRCGIEVRRLVFWTILAWFLRLIWMTDGASLQGSPST